MVSTMGHYSKHRLIKSLRYLLAQGANPDGRDAEGRTPLDFAHYHEWPEGVKLLRARGARAHTPGRTYSEKEKLSAGHVCPALRPQPGSNGLPPVIGAPFFTWQDPGPDGPLGGIICEQCRAEQ